MTPYIIENTLYSKTTRKPFSFVHITDSHLTLSDEDDDAQKTKNAKERTGCFENPSGLSIKECLKEQLLIAKRQDDFVLFTGDIVDFPGKSNMEYLTEQLGDYPFIYTYGNHDWHYLWEKEESALKKQRTPTFQKDLGNPVMRAEEINGVCFIGLDNGDYEFSEAQCNFVEAQLRKGQDTILYYHIPLYADTLIDDVVHYWRAPIVVGVDNERKKKIKTQDVRDILPSTNKMLSILEKHKEQIIALICGHIHFSHEDKTVVGIPQYITEAGCYGTMRRFTVIVK